MTEANPPEESQLHQHFPNFSISSERLEAMRSDFISAAETIRRAIAENRPILLRHHSDCDGYSAALSLEQAILPLIEECHRRERPWIYYKRIPNKSPYYNYSDALRDLSSSLSDSERFGLRSPLIMLVDFGVSKDELYILRHLKIYHAKIIIIDHHEPGLEGESMVEYRKLVDAALNPHFLGFDGNITAGMLAFELSRIINTGIGENFLLPSLSGISDKSECPELDEYLKRAKSKFSAEFIKSLAECIDFLAYTLGQAEARRIVSDLFFEPEIQENLVSILLPEVKRRREAAIASAMHLAKIETLGRIRLAQVEFSGMARQDYPPQGRIAGMCFDELSKNEHNLVLFFILPDSIIIRSNAEKFSAPNFVSFLGKKLSLFGIEGGGHASAGTVRFFHFAKAAVIEEARAYLERL